MADAKAAATTEAMTEGDPTVKAFLVHNTSVGGQLMLAGTVVDLPRSVATNLRDRGGARKPTEDEVKTLYRTAPDTPPFGEEPETEKEAATA